MNFVTMTVVVSVLVIVVLILLIYQNSDIDSITNLGIHNDESMCTTDNVIWLNGICKCRRGYHGDNCEMYENSKFQILKDTEVLIDTEYIGTHNIDICIKKMESLVVDKALNISKPSRSTIPKRLPVTRTVNTTRYENLNTHNTNSGYDIPKLPTTNTIIYENSDINSGYKNSDINSGYNILRSRTTESYNSVRLRRPLITEDSDEDDNDILPTDRTTISENTNDCDISNVNSNYENSDIYENYDTTDIKNDNDYESIDTENFMGFSNLNTNSNFKYLDTIDNFKSNDPPIGIKWKKDGDCYMVYKGSQYNIPSKHNGYVLYIKNENLKDIRH